MTGTLKVIKDTVKINDKFSKREFVLSDDDVNYPQYILFQLVQDKVDYLDKFVEGESIEVSFNLRGREWKSPQDEIKYFNSLEAWRIQGVKVEEPAKEDDGLPF